MIWLENIGFWVAVALYAVTTSLGVVSIVSNRPRATRAAVIVVCLAMLAHTVGLAAHVIQVERIPVATRYENVFAGAWAVMVGALLVYWRRRNLILLLALGATFALLMLGYATLHRPGRTPGLPAIFDNPWMYVHIFFAWLAYANYVIAATLSILYLLPSSGEDKRGLRSRLPEPEVLEDLTFRSIAYGFITHAVMVASGSIWARDLWGDYWSWDPVETWSLISWLVYGLWIHLRLTLRWRGRRMAWLALAALVTVIIAFWGTNLFGPSEHTLENLRDVPL